MPTKTRYADHVKDWQDLIGSVTANAANLPQLETARARLDQLRTEVRELTVQQAAHQANKQEVSRRLRALIGQGRKVASMMRAVVREQYGNQSEKLVEFGLQPLRARVRKKTPAPTPAPQPEPVPPPTPTTASKPGE